MPKINALLTVAIALLLPACGTTGDGVKMVPLDSLRRAAKVGPVDILEPGESIYRPEKDMTLYPPKEIAILTLEVSEAGESAGIAYFASKARQLGADAIVMWPAQELSSPFGVRYILKASAVAFEK